MNRQIFNEKMTDSVKTGSLAKITEKLQMCGREQKNKKDQTLLFVHHAQSHSH